MMNQIPPPVSACKFKSRIYRDNRITACHPVIRISLDTANVYIHLHPTFTFLFFPAFAWSTSDTSVEPIRREEKIRITTRNIDRLIQLEHNPREHNPTRERHWPRR